jgi:hypothetical protein
MAPNEIVLKALLLLDMQQYQPQDLMATTLKLRVGKQNMRHTNGLAQTSVDMLSAVDGN